MWLWFYEDTKGLVYILLVNRSNVKRLEFFLQSTWRTTPVQRLPRRRRGEEPRNCKENKPSTSAGTCCSTMLTRAVGSRRVCFGLSKWCVVPRLDDQQQGSRDVGPTCCSQQCTRSTTEWRQPVSGGDEYLAADEYDDGACKVHQSWKAQWSR